jgi:hypothetical protein
VEPIPPRIEPPPFWAGAGGGACLAGCGGFLTGAARGAGRDLAELRRAMAVGGGGEDETLDGGAARRGASE